MESERAPGQKLIPIPMNEKFIKELNGGYKTAGYDNRSQFIRDAILEKLERLGIKIPPELALAPDRLGKGGRSNATYTDLGRGGGLKLADKHKKPNSSASGAAGRLLKKASASVAKTAAP